jgi:hypothetical protein
MFVIIIILVSVMFTSAKEVMFSPPSVCLSVCSQDISKSYERIWMKLSGMIGHVPRTNRLDFGDDLDVFCGSRIILKVSLPLRDRAKSRTAQLGEGMRSTECHLLVCLVCLKFVFYN